MSIQILQGRPSFAQNLVKGLAESTIPSAGKSIADMIGRKKIEKRAADLEKTTGIPGFANLVIASGGDVNKAAEAYQNLSKSRAMLADLGLEGGGGGQGQDQGLYGAVGPQQPQQQRLPEPTPTDIYDRSIKAENVDREQNLAQEPLSGQQMTNRWQQFSKTPEFQQMKQTQKGQEAPDLQPIESDIELEPLTPIPNRPTIGQRAMSADKIKRMSYYNPQTAAVQARLLSQQEKVQEFERKEAEKRLSPFTDAGSSHALRRQELATVKAAVASNKVGPLSGANLSAITGRPEFKNAAGAAMETALKSYLIESLNKVTSGAGRPNMFIEQQITNGFPLIGSPQKANEAKIAVLEMGLLREEQYAKLVTKIKQQYEDQYGSVPPDRVLSEADRQMRTWDQRAVTSLEDKIYDLSGIETIASAKKKGEIASDDVIRRTARITQGDPEEMKKILEKHGYKTE